MLSEQGVLVEGDGAELGVEVSARFAPQLNFFREVMPSAVEAQERVAAATVAVFGLSGAGATTALSLAAAGVGTVVCIDALPVATTDVYLSPCFTLEEVGRGRAMCVAAKIHATAPEVRVSCIEQPLVSEEDVRSTMTGAGFVVCCLDAAQSNLAYKLNRVCLADGIRWISCSLDGLEITVGPAVHPGQSACYLCYQMRLAACAGNPEDAFAYQKYLDRRKCDDSGKRENLVFGAGLAANLLGVEVLKELTGLAEPSLVGRILTVGLSDLNIQKHAVLRKPWCPACFPKSDGEHGS
jgi:adenylyltransferase/sulfurtransferase